MAGKNMGKGVIADKMYWNSNNYELIINESSIPPNLIIGTDLQSEVDNLMPITKKLHLIYEDEESLNEETMNTYMSLTMNNERII